MYDKPRFSPSGIFIASSGKQSERLAIKPLIFPVLEQIIDILPKFIIAPSVFSSFPELPLKFSKLAFPWNCAKGSGLLQGFPEGTTASPSSDIWPL